MISERNVRPAGQVGERKEVLQAVVGTPRGEAETVVPDVDGVSDRVRAMSNVSTHTKIHRCARLLKNNIHRNVSLVFVVLGRPLHLVCTVCRLVRRLVCLVVCSDFVCRF